MKQRDLTPITLGVYVQAGIERNPWKKMVLELMVEEQVMPIGVETQAELEALLEKWADEWSDKHLEEMDKMKAANPREKMNPPLDWEQWVNLMYREAKEMTENRYLQMVASQLMMER